MCIINIHVVHCSSLYPGQTKTEELLLNTCNHNVTAASFTVAIMATASLIIFENITIFFIPEYLKWNRK